MKIWIIVCFFALITVSVGTGHYSEFATLNELKRHHAALEKMRSEYQANSIRISENFNKIIKDSL